MVAKHCLLQRVQLLTEESQEQITRVLAQNGDKKFTDHSRVNNNCVIKRMLYVVDHRNCHSGKGWPLAAVNTI